MTDGAMMADMTGNAVLVVADDLTGANATAAGFARAGLRAVTVGADQPPEVVAEFGSRFDVVVVSTGSRHLPPEQAAARVVAAVRAGWPVSLVANRVDSTLRGNVGASTSAALRAVADESGRRAVALCVPAHPEARRQTVDGTQLLDGARLEETELARDPRSPIRHSDVAALIREQADLRVRGVHLTTVTGDGAEMRDAIRAHLDDGAEVIVCDALTIDHLDRIARAAVSAADDDVVWVAVDPGPASIALAAALGVTGHGGSAPVLAVSGSATQLTRSQLARLRAEEPVSVVRAVPGHDTPVPDVDATAAALDAAVAGAAAGDVVLLATVLDDADVVQLRPADAERLPTALARATRRVLEERRVDGIFATGGDVAAALFTELGAHGLDVERELEPLAVAGTFVGGPWAGLPVVTKGGLVGDTGTTVACVDHIRRAAETSRRHVRAAQSRDVSTTANKGPVTGSRPVSRKVTTP